eukprot:c28941_g1_i1 orf=3-185(-)
MTPPHDEEGAIFGLLAQRSALLESMSRAPKGRVNLTQIGASLPLLWASCEDGLNKALLIKA